MIKDNILRIRESISSACAKANRDPGEITVVAISKGRTVDEIKEAIDAGITDIGESKVQEALVKYNNLRPTTYNLRLKWHLIGHLQTNKAKEAVKIFDLIHSVDSLRLAQEIDKQAAKINKVQGILLEVKTSPEATKFGLKPEEAEAAIKEISGLKNINIKGLMTIAPMVDAQEKARPYFKRLREIMEAINAMRNTHDAIRILSMGMSDDFEVAIREGATMVRLGRAIFG